MADGKPHPLVGKWRLLSCEHRMPGGRVWRPFGPRPKGRLVYTADGWMMVMLMDPRRPAASGGLFEASASERAEAARGFVAYSGRWEARGSTVRHEVDLSLFPNWVGRTQVRRFALRGRRVAFSTKAFEVGGVRQTASLVWTRDP